MDFCSQSGERLAEERKRLKLSQDVVGSLCGVSREMWGKYERGRAAMGADVLARFSEAGGDVLYILTGTRNDQTAKSTQEGSILRAFRLIPQPLQTDLARLMISMAGPEYFKTEEVPIAPPPEAA